MNKPVVLLGAGGHALVLLDTLLRLKYEIKAVVAPKNENESSAFLPYKRYEADEDVYSFNPDKVHLVNGIGSLPNQLVRQNLFKKFKGQGYQFLTVIAPNADVSPMAKVGEGVQLMSGVVVQAGSYIADNTIVNTGATVDHDCQISTHCHIAPGVTLSGGVSLAEGCHVGTGAQVIQNIKVEKGCVVGAGACLTENLTANSVVYPAKVYIRENNK